MRNLRDRDHALKVALHGGSARRKSAGSAGFAAQGMITSIRLDNKKPRRKIVPASEHLRLTDIKIDRRCAESENAQMDGQKMKENRDAL
jgi:hypothetical protein